MDDQSEEEDNLYFKVLGLSASVVILVVNLPLLWIVLNKAKPTLINKLIGLDCLIGLLNIPNAINAGGWHIFPCGFHKFVLSIDKQK